MNRINLSNQNKNKDINWLSSRKECYEKCMNQVHPSICFAVSVSLKDRGSYIICSLYANGDVNGKGAEEAVIIHPNTRESVQYTAVKGSSTSNVIINTNYLRIFQYNLRILNLRVRETITTTTTNNSTATSEKHCLNKCNDDPLCSVFTYKLNDGGNNCWTYFEDSVTCEDDKSSTASAMRARRSENCQNIFVADGYVTTFMPYKIV